MEQAIEFIAEIKKTCKNAFKNKIKNYIKLAVPFFDDPEWLDPVPQMNAF